MLQYFSTQLIGRIFPYTLTFLYHSKISFIEISCYLILFIFYTTNSITILFVKQKLVLQFLIFRQTEVMVISRHNECPQINISINLNKLKQRDQLKYLGPVLTSNSRSSIQIASRKAPTNEFETSTTKNRST